jgi:hypothetical protein
VAETRFCPALKSDTDLGAAAILLAQNLLDVFDF